MNGQTSKACIYWINTLMITLALLVVGFSLYAVADPDNVSVVVGTQLPKWMFFFSGAFALGIILISSLGICSARTQSKIGYAVYILVVLSALIVQVACAAYLAREYGNMDNATASSLIDDAKLPEGIKNLEEDIVNLAIKPSNAEQWKQTQDALKCCGYDLRWASEQSTISSSDMLDTGKVCTDNLVALQAARVAVKLDISNLKAQTEILNKEVDSGAFFCKGEIIAAGKKYSLYITITAGVLAFFQLVAVLAASRLACCISKKEGGYMEDWRPSTREQQYQASSITGTSAAGQPVVGGAQYNYA